MLPQNIAFILHVPQVTVKGVTYKGGKVLFLNSDVEHSFGMIVDIFIESEEIYCFIQSYITEEFNPHMSAYKIKRDNKMQVMKPKLLVLLSPVLHTLLDDNTFDAMQFSLSDREEII